MEKPTKNFAGTATHIILSLLFVYLAFGKIIPDINNVYFSKNGDGFRTYYGMYYHAKYDSSYHHIGAMNYPYGELLNFTDCQPPVSNTIRFISNNIIDISAYTTGINNALMILSMVLASIFIFLILRKLKVSWWFASPVALSIVFLSPQIQRMGGHFSLSWMFWIPLSIYLLTRFNKKESWATSIFVAFSAFIAGSMHYYFLAFWIFMFFPYWLYRWFLQKEFPFKKLDLLHLFIQVFLPLILLQLNLIINDNITDRTSNPWGFYAFKGHPAGVFLPLFKSYFPFFNKLGFAHRVPWEAFSYIGIVASVVFFIMSYQWISKSIKHKAVQSFTNNKILDYLTGISFLVLLFSFGIPFIFGLDKLRQIAGPLGQLRGVARFGWLFYYTVNIVAFRYIYFKYFELNSKYKGKILAFFFVSVFAFEAWSYSAKYQNILNNHMPETEVQTSGSIANVLTNNFEADNFQAILPLPYFNIGSESIWLEPKCESMQNSFIASMVTGLPNIGVMAARTSISQAYKNIALTLLPWKAYEVLNDYPNNKPILLSVARCNELRANEQRLIRHSEQIASSNDYDFYTLHIDTLRALPSIYNYPKHYAAINDSIKKTAINSQTFWLNQNQLTLSRKFSNAAECKIKTDTNKPVFLRFWVNNFETDLVARTQILIIQADTTHQTFKETYTDIFKNICTIDKQRALLEIKLDAQKEEQIIKLSFKNSDLKGYALTIDEVSISQIGLH